MCLLPQACHFLDHFRHLEQLPSEGAYRTQGPAGMGSEAQVEGEHFRHPVPQTHAYSGFWQDKGPIWRQNGMEGSKTLAGLLRYLRVSLSLRSEKPRAMCQTYTVKPDRPALQSQADSFTSLSLQHGGREEKVLKPTLCGCCQGCERRAQSIWAPNRAQQSEPIMMTS